MKTLEDYYPSNTHTVEEITDKEKALEYFNSKSSPAWGAGKIENTGYYQLMKFTDIMLTMSIPIYNLLWVKLAQL